MSAEARQAQDWLERAKAEAEERGMTLSEVMNERAARGEAKL